MKNESNLIPNWSDDYLNTLEYLYGPINEHPELSIAELCEEWKNCFREDGRLQLELQRDRPLMEWSESYLDTIQKLYGEFNLYPRLTIQELCEEWQECFTSDGNKQGVAS